ncbi:hypothetical protein DSO57_1000783 [Entomophthora muscae]|uniref:Uncharacterized protein n=1 Tax=Entomophthora muscae TaxID=34485 RepID=A0ACC2T8W6_9FUNG|nr:hypothetical protein DSO57_1000783 [Entomophthora muscae]
MTLKEIKRTRKLLKMRSKKLLSIQDEEKSLVAHVYIPPLSPPSPLSLEDPVAFSCVLLSITALNLGLEGTEVPQTASNSLGPTDPDTSPFLCYPDSQEIEKDQLNRILTIVKTAGSTFQQGSK